MKSKHWGISLLLLTLAGLILCGCVTAVIDPFFHYHGPLPFLQYPIDDQRYQNDGIVRHFDYDAIITGTSLTENFKSSQMDELFGVHSVKVCASGGTYNELCNTLRRGFAANSNIRLVLMGLDSWFLFEQPGALRTDAEYPLYLYDNNPFNDIRYLLNKQVLCSRTMGVLEHTLRGGTTTSFDEYSFWGSSGYGVTGKEIAITNSPRHPLSQEQLPFTALAQKQLRENLENNILAIASEHPDTQFILFFPPYSILYWDYLDRSGELDRQLEAWLQATEQLLEADNIQLFSFYNDFATVTNLDNYRDNVHYGSDINALLMQRMAQGEGLLTWDNYRSHWQAVGDFYRSYDYDSIYE